MARGLWGCCWLAVSATVWSMSGCSQEATPSYSTSSTTGVGGGQGGIGGATGQGGVGGDGGSGGMSFDNPVQLRVLDPIAQSPVPGVQVCLRELPTSCGITDAEGRITLEAPLTGSWTFEYSGASIRPHILAVRSNGGATSFSTTAVSDGNVNLIFQLLGITEDPSKGIVVSGVNVANAVASLSAASGDGPYYAGPTGLPDPNLTATSTTGVFFYGNVDAGFYDASVTASSLQCTTWVGVIGSQPSLASVEVQPGTVTLVSPFLCL